MPWDTWVILACEVATAGGVLAAALVARRALCTWRDELVGRSRFELARSILYSSHLLARSIQAYRSIFSHQDRTPEGVARAINEPAAELDQCFIEARFLFPSTTLEEERTELKACVDDLYLAAARYGREMEKPEDKQDEKRLDEYTTIIWSPGGDDSFAARVARAVEALTGKLQPFVDRR